MNMLRLAELLDTMIARRRRRLRRARTAARTRRALRCPLRLK
jgi:hypothetical protein